MKFALQDVADLPTLFKIGMMVPCKILSVENTKQSGVKVKLSINPEDINKDLSPESLHNGMVCILSVHLIYLLNLGLKTII